MGVEETILVKLLVRVAVIASMASILLRFSFARRMLMRERRTFKQRAELGLLFGVMFACGTLVRIVLKYDAAELALEGAFVSGLVGGYITGLAAGGVMALPAALLTSPHEWLAIPLLVGVGALGGVLRDIAPSDEEIWRFSPFFPFTISNWVRRLPSPESAFQMLLLFTCFAIEFLRQSVGHAFEHHGWLFTMFSKEDGLSTFTMVAIYFSTVACIGLNLKVWDHSRNEWKLEEQQRLLMQARLRNLSSQINPHFLFNTLNSVASLIRSDRDMAREVIVKLSAILRRLMRSQEALAPLRDELRFIENYLEIEQVRFGDKLRVHEEFDPETLDKLVPSMVLQPLVENSIKHGLGPKVSGGSIWLRSAHRGGRLQIEVEDDGVGIPEEVLPIVFQAGIGIGNVHERLSVLFGNDFQMTIENRTGGGTRIRIQIPELRDFAPAAPKTEESAQTA
ncbi:MAG: histidine kinase [Bryobacterales bacterium]|nr:histidine kinase [Acidobacteriota bacterium]MCB9384099.1 histidine kinase [Bryobacterales bacterium]